MTTNGRAGLLGPRNTVVPLPVVCAGAPDADAAAKKKAHKAFLMLNAMFKSTLPQTA
ncbi:MAG TPA: hypothetical protein VF611_00355 [Pyrinomonadaceae bacterium]|jgi:hypothetical protein